VSCDAILEEGETIVRLLSKYRYSANGGRNDEVKILSGMMKDNFPEFSAARFFSIDRTTIFGILQSITTFFIILIQFNFA
jgi:gustatory receptor